MDSLSDIGSQLPNQKLPPYKYTPLNPSNSIRLLELVHATCTEIRCFLKVVDMDKAPAFDALSYTWGNPLTPFSNLKHEYHTGSQRIFPVICDDGEILVTASLRHALRMLQVLDLRKVKKIRAKQKFFWIDAICIDQENIEERGSQVAIMADIYQAASTVIIWLGEEDEFTSDACTVINRLSKVSSDRYSAIKPTHWWDQGPTLRKIGTKPLDFRNWLGFLAFMNRPWFKRAWIVQELILAKLPVIVCGSAVILWETVSRTIDFLINTGWYNHLHTEWLKVHHPIITSNFTLSSRSPSLYGINGSPRQDIRVSRSFEER